MGCNLTGGLRLPLLCLGLLASAAAPVRALPDPTQPIDPTRRAEISTKDAVRPGGGTVKGDGVVPLRVIRMSELPVRKVELPAHGRTPTVAEARPKVVIQKKNVRSPAAETRRRGEVKAARDMPASIPRLRRERFQKMITEYRRGRIPADAFLHDSIEVGGRSIDLAEINKYANPRAALEQQGIPVKKAGAAAEKTDEATVPIPAEKR